MENLSISKLLALFATVVYVSNIGLFAQSNIEFDAEKVTTEVHNFLLEEKEEWKEVLILLHEQVDFNGLSLERGLTQADREDRTRIVLHSLRKVADKHQVSFVDFLGNMDGVDQNSIQRHWIVNGISLSADAAAIGKLSMHPQVALVEQVIVPILDEPSPSEVSFRSQNGREPGHDMINAPALWEMGYTGYGTKVLVFDSGNDPFHPAVNSSFLWHNYPLEWVWSGLGDYVMDCMSHGTHVGGTITGLDRRTNDTIGVAFNARWMSAPINFGRCNRPFYQPILSTIQAFEWAMNPDGDPSTVDDVPDVINCSWTSGSNQNCNNESSRLMMDALQAAGIAVVWSAGNNGPEFGTIRGLGSINNGLVNSFSVGAVNFHGEIADFSSRGPAQCPVGDFSLDIKPEVTAPGVGIRSAITGGGYAQFNGTSMASPHVSGALLLLKEAFPYLDGETLLMSLYLSAVDRGEPGEDNTYGMGIIDVLAAFNYLMDQGYDPVPPVSNRLDAVLFDVFIADRPVCNQDLTAQVSIQNAGSDTIHSMWIRWDFFEHPELSDSVFWEGSLAPAEIMEFPVRFNDHLPIGDYEVVFSIDSPNGEIDFRDLNNVFKYQFGVVDGEVYEAEVEVGFVDLKCLGSRVVLQFESDSEADVRWFSSAVGGNPIGLGNEFITDQLLENTTYYADVFSSHSVGKGAISNELDFSFLEEEAGLLFDAMVPFLLKSVKVFVSGPGLRSFRVADKYGNVLFNRSFFLSSSGEHRIDLNLNIPAGRDHRIILVGGSGLLGDSDGGNFPYTAGDFLSIQQSVIPDFDGWEQQAYLFFYDWEVEVGQACGRSAVHIELLDSMIAPIVIVTDTVVYQLQGGLVSVDFSAEWVDNEGFEWDFGNGETGLGDIVSTAFAEPGEYEIVVRSVSQSGCANLATVTILIEDEPVSTVDFSDKTVHDLTLYPNPTSGYLYVGFGSSETTSVQYSILNSLGSELQTGSLQAFDSGLFHLDVSRLSPGYYLLRVSSADGSMCMGRFVVQ